MKLAVDAEMKRHLNEIMREDKNEQQWSEVAACDWFQSDNYCGGFEEIEMEFTFSFYDRDGIEYWFQFPLSAVPDAVSKPDFVFDARLAEW